MEHARQLVEAGIPLDKATNALIMLHGRGATAQDILSLRNYLPLDKFYVVAPQATNHTWYPYSFLSPPAQNEPWLTSALNLINSVVQSIEEGGINSEHTFILGFSQGACLSLEFAARNARKWGGVIAFTGGLIGDKINTANYKGNFGSTKVFIGNSDRDPHVPLSRSEDSARVLEEMGATVIHKVYTGMGHTVNEDEIANAARILS
jgi:phospholipase/carboxylesterase